MITQGSSHTHDTHHFTLYATNSTQKYACHCNVIHILACWVLCIAFIQITAVSPLLFSNIISAVPCKVVRAWTLWSFTAYKCWTTGGDWIDHDATLNVVIATSHCNGMYDQVMACCNGVYDQVMICCNYVRPPPQCASQPLLQCDQSNFPQSKRLNHWWIIATCRLPTSLR